MNDKTRFEQLLETYPDDIRHPLTRDSDDWDNVILPVLSEYLIMQPFLMIYGFESNADTLSCLCQAIYTMGYNRGKNESE